MMAVGPTPVCLREEQQFAGSPGQSRVFGGKDDRGGGRASNGAGSTLDVVVGGKCRLLLMPAVMLLIFQRERKDSMSMGRWTEHDAWAYRGGRE